MSNYVPVPMLRSLFARYMEVKAAPMELGDVTLDEAASNRFFSVFRSGDGRVAYVRANQDHNVELVSGGILAYINLPEVRDPVKLHELTPLRRHGVRELQPICSPQCGPMFKKHDSLSHPRRFAVFLSTSDHTVAKIWFPNSARSEGDRIVAEYHEALREPAQSSAPAAPTSGVDILPALFRVLTKAKET
jgi:hypothetical protein